MATSISVRERVERDIFARLQTITVANGFALDLVPYRRRGFPRSADDAYQIWQQFDDTEYKHRSASGGGSGTGMLDEVVRMHLIYGVPDSEDDRATDLNAARAAIRQALVTNDSLYIPYTLYAGSSAELRQIQFTLLGDTIDFTEQVTALLLLGEYMIDVQYSTLRGNPYQWDSGDVPLTE